MRKQNGFQHQCSVLHLSNEIPIMLRKYIALDELLIMRCFYLHDIPEGILGEDLPAPTKKQSDDLKEYLAFEKLFKPLGADVWKEYQRAYLLQFILEDFDLFPADAQEVMHELRRQNYSEALTFQAIQMMDYMYYAEDCCENGAVSTVLEEVTVNAIEKLDWIAKRLPGFREMVWTAERRAYFEAYLPGRIKLTRISGEKLPKKSLHQA